VAFLTALLLGGLRKTTESVSKDSRFLRHDLGPAPHEYIVGALTTVKSSVLRAVLYVHKLRTKVDCLM
jgi:hypothetical protein